MFFIVAEGYQSSSSMPSIEREAGVFSPLSSPPYVKSLFELTVDRHVASIMTIL